MSRAARLHAGQMTVKDSESWHADYKDSAYIYAGGLSFELTEGDVVCIFSQYGEVLDVNLIRDKHTGISKGFAFLRYEDQRSTILAVDNLSGAKVLGRSLKVDHVNEYKQPKREGESTNDWEQDPRASMNVAPEVLLKPVEVLSDRETARSVEADYTKGIDPEDPMFDYLVNERRETALISKQSRHSKEKRERRSRSHRSRSPHRKERVHRSSHHRRTHDRDHDQRSSHHSSSKDKSDSRTDARHRSRS